MLEAVKNRMKGELLKRGYVLATAAGLPGSILLTALRDIFRNQRVDCVIDVGANLGQYRDFLRSVLHYEGEIISFEPIPDHFARLNDMAAKDKHWRVFPFALGAENTIKTFNVMRGTTFSSFRAPLASEHPFSAGNTISSRIDVDVRRLDDALFEANISVASRRVFVKADTQGYDLEVFRGAPKVMAQAVGLQSEVSVIPLYEQSVDYLDTIRELHSYGLSMAALAPVSVSQGLVVEFDCVMIRSL